MFNRLLLSLCVAAPLAATGLVFPSCSAPPATPSDSGSEELDAGTPYDAGPDVRDAGLPGLPLKAWTWLPVDGSQCGSGARAGVGVNLGPSTRELVLFFQGGGACWNQGTCIPSLQSFGPVCDYGTVCLWNVPGGQLSLASHVTGDPFPADGGGAFPNELAQIASSVLLTRTEPSNVFKDSTYVFVPYCTGDLHAGNASRVYQYKLNLFDQPSNFTMHYAGATNVQRYLEVLAGKLPNLTRVWVVGVSAGGYGAQLNLERIQRAFPRAAVHVLADSAPLLDTPHWTEWRDAWNLELPAGCTDCDAGFPQFAEHFATTSSGSRQALVTSERDKVIAYYFFGGTGTASVVTPPTGAFAAALGPLLAKDDTHANSRYFIVAGEEHVQLGGAGVVRPDGGVTAPLSNRDGGTTLKRFVDDWATGAPGWRSAP